MSRVRSPNYPSSGLPEAIERIKKVHDAQQHLSEPRNVVAQHMGYGGLNGSALKSLSSLLKFGLLSDVGNGDLKVSERALSILFAESSLEKSKAIYAAAIDPQRFSEIHDRWEGGNPSDESLRNYLVRRQFSTKAIDSVIKNYRATFELVSQDIKPANQVEVQAVGGEDEIFENEEELGEVNKGDIQTLEVSNSTGMKISFLGTSIQLNGSIGTQKDVKKAVDAISALGALLPE